jgi:DNA-binding NarL/FixJ family response regulator
VVEPKELHLTRRERQIVALLLEGCTNKSIAARLGVSDQTVKNQLSALYQKAGVSGRLALVMFALRNGLVPNR